MKVVPTLLYGAQRFTSLMYTIPLLGPLWDLFTGLTHVLLTFFAGSFAASGIRQSKKPEKILKLYVYDGCPFCRKVMVAVTTLGLDVMVYPCPRTTLKSYGVIGESRFRGKAKEIGGAAQFPLLIDENLENPVVYESDVIIKHLWTAYGDKAKEPLSYTLFKYLGFLGFFRNLLRPLSEQGMLRIPSIEPKEPLVLWGYEGSPFVLRATEVLCCLELPYLYRSVPKGYGHKRKEFTSHFGHLLSAGRKALPGIVQVPLLIDPNNGDKIILESATIMKYLRETYQDGDAPNESILDYSSKGAKGGHKTF